MAMEVNLLKSHGRHAEKAAVKQGCPIGTAAGEGKHPLLSSFSGSLPAPPPCPTCKKAASLAVAGEHLLTGLADFGTVGLQAAQNAEDVLRIDFELGLAKLGHIRMASVALLRTALAQRSIHRRRLWRQALAESRCAHGKRDCNRIGRNSKHDPPLRASGPSTIFDSYLTLFGPAAHIKFSPID